ncbi:MAG: sulfotransferase [Nodosilinea sp.]
MEFKKLKNLRAYFKQILRHWLRKKPGHEHLSTYPSGFNTETLDISATALKVARRIREAERAPAIMIHGVMQRSGTVFLGELLRLHPDLYAYPNEIWEIPFLKFTNHLLDFENDFLNAYPKNQGKVRAHDFLPLFGSAFIGYLYDYIPEGKRMLLKDPNVNYLAYFFALFPHENLLLLLRDGRDVVNSTIKTWPNSDFVEVCQRWNDSVTAILGFVDREGDRSEQFILAKYEEAVQEPAEFVRTVCLHFNLNPDKFPYEEIENIPLRGSSFKKQEGKVTWEPIAKDGLFQPSGKWNDWPIKLKRIFKAIAGQTLIDSGYVSDFDW